MTARHPLLAILLAASPALASAVCPEPRPPERIPDGQSATAEEMAAAGREVRDYNARVETYLACLRSEANQAAIGADATEKAAIEARRHAAHNASVDRLIGVSNCFNEELRKFRIFGGGKRAEAADCTSYMEAAARGAPPNAPIQTTQVIDSPGHTLPAPGGTWNYYLRTGGPRVACYFSDDYDCALNQLYVRNGSTVSLECRYRLTYPRGNSMGRLVVEGAGVVLAKTEKPVLQDTSMPESVPSVVDVDCTPMPPLPPLSTSRDCQFKLTKPVSLADYYPPAGRRMNEEGPVIVEFRLPKPEGRPSDITVAQSSLSERLDAAAIRAVGDMRMSTTCPDQRYRMVVRFQLTD